MKKEWYDENTFNDEEYTRPPVYSPLVRILIGTTALLLGAGFWWLVIWGCIEGYKHVGR